MSPAVEKTVLPAEVATCPSLIVGLQQGDEQAWRRMVEAYGPLVYGWCRRWGLSPEDAGDVGQETFRAVAAAVGGFRPERGRGSFGGWLRTIARRKTVDLWRRRDAELPQAEGGSQAYVQLAQAPAPDAGDDDTESLGELAGVVRRVLPFLREEFEPTTWQAFWAMAVEGRRASDVGAELGLTANAVRVAKCKVLRRLRQELGETVEP